MVGVVALYHMHLGIMETFLRKILLNHGLGVVLEVRRHLRALADSGFYLHILFLALLQSLISHFADTRTLLQLDDEPDLVALYLACFDLHIGEQPLFPEALDRFGNLVARYFYLVSHSQAGEADKYEILVAVRSLYRYAGNLVGLACHTVFNLLRKNAETEQQE